MKPAQPKASVYFRSLGCAKNQVDTEVMLGALALGGYAIAERLEHADVAVVNTCCFIESAREESVEVILELAESRRSGHLRLLVVAGCLPQRYGEALARELPEVDLFLGTGQFQNIVALLGEALAGRRDGVYVEAGKTYLYGADDPRLLLGGHHSAYVKIAEGCDRACAFCVIPAVRGRFQSRPMESVLREVSALAREGVREINLVSQDTTSYGKDLPGRPWLHELVRALDDVGELDWIRLLYLYPSGVSEALMDVLAESKHVLPYLDVPLQHASDRLLRTMKRGVTADRQRRLVARLRARIPHLTLRTTFIVGFPGETERDFDELCDFVRELRFDRVGVFCYSDEEGTQARSYPEKVTRSVSRQRYCELMEIQRGIMVQKLESRVGEEVEVLVDRAAAGMSIGRVWSQAPEVDGVVFLKGEAAAGSLLRARVTGVRELDLEAELLAVPPVVG